MTLEKIFAAEVAAVIEETSSFLTNRLVMESLLKNGKVTLEEAQYFNTLATEVLTEAAEEFIPDEIEVPEVPTAEAKEESTQTAAEEATKEETVEESTQTAAEEATKEETVEESTQTAAEEATKEETVEESAQTAAEEATKEELTESEIIVNKLISKLL